MTLSQKNKTKSQRTKASLEYVQGSQFSDSPLYLPAGDQMQMGVPDPVPAIKPLHGPSLALEIGRK